MRLRRTWWRFGSIALVVVALALTTTLALAQSYDPNQDLPKPTKLQKRLDKLSRGLSNVLFGWSEIPLSWDHEIKQNQPLTRIITHGTVVGTTKFFMRLGIGLYEVFGFYVENPGGGYKPMIEPEYLF